MPVKVTRKGTSQKKLQALDAGIRTGITASGLYFIEEVRRTLQLVAPRGYATGGMIRSLTVSKVVYVNGAFTARAGTSIGLYPWFVHWGTGPQGPLHRPIKAPPIDVIYRWLKEKGITPRFTKRVPKTLRKYTHRVARSVRADPEFWTLAFLISRKIGRVGLTPLPFLTTTFKVAEPRMREILIENVRRSLRSS